MDTPTHGPSLYKVGGLAALAVVLIIPFQVVIFAVYPPPETTLGFLELFRDHWWLGLLSLDFLYYFNNAFMILLYLALFQALRTTEFSTLLMATVIGLVGIAAYYSSSMGFEMLSLSRQYYATDSPEVKQQLLAAGQGLLVRYKGTAFDVYYVFNAIYLLLVSKVMLRSEVFGRTAAVWGLVAGIFMIIPSTAGILGLVFSLVSLIPWIVFSILVGSKLLVMGRVDAGLEGPS